MPWRPGAAELHSVSEKGDELLQVFQRGAQRASANPFRGFPIVLLLAALLAAGALFSQPAAVTAAAYKVVVVVGPTGSQTASYITSAKSYAALAKSYGATVYQLYSPYANWERVRQYAQGANLLIYLGHGNGWPSPYPPFQENTKDGMGLNAAYGSSTLRYYGANYIRSYIRLAPDAVVILNRLCYASGNNEWGVTPDPSVSTAVQRVDNFGSGFLRAGAKAVFAEGVTDASYIIRGLFDRTKVYTMTQLFWSSPNKVYTYRITYRSQRTSGAMAVLDPKSPGKYYRSVVGHIGSTTTTMWRTP